MPSRSQIDLQVQVSAAIASLAQHREQKFRPKLLFEGKLIECGRRDCALWRLVRKTMEGPSNGAAESLENSDAPERGETSTSLPLAHPAGPMTYTELTRSGVGRTMPELLWVPYFSDMILPSHDQIQAASSTTPGEGLEGNRRELSKSVDSLNRGRSSRSQSKLQAGEGRAKEKPWLLRKVVKIVRPVLGTSGAFQNASLFPSLIFIFVGLMSSAICTCSNPLFPRFCRALVT